MLTCLSAMKKSKTDILYQSLQYILDTTVHITNKPFAWHDLDHQHIWDAKQLIIWKCHIHKSLLSYNQYCFLAEIVVQTQFLYNNRLVHIPMHNVCVHMCSQFHTQGSYLFENTIDLAFHYIFIHHNAECSHCPMVYEHIVFKLMLKRHFLITPIFPCMF